MKKLFYSSSAALMLLVSSCGTLGTGTTASSSAGSAVGQVLGAAANVETIGNVIGNIIGLNTLTAKQLYGTWKYKGPGCAFTSQNALAKAGGEMVASEIKQKLQTQYSQVGFTPSNTQLTLNSDGTFSAKIGGKAFSGTYTYNEKTNALQLKGLLLSLSGYATRNSSGISVLFESKKLLTLMQTLTALSGNSTLSAIGNISKNYDGVRLGFDMKK